MENSDLRVATTLEGAEADAALEADPNFIEESGTKHEVEVEVTLGKFLKPDDRSTE